MQKKKNLMEPLTDGSRKNSGTIWCRTVEFIQFADTCKKWIQACFTIPIQILKKQEPQEFEGTDDLHRLVGRNQ